MSLLPALVFLVFKRRLAFDEDEAKLWRNFSLVAIGAAIALAVTPSSTAVDRIALYLLPLQFIVLARIPGTLVSRNFGNLLVSGYTAAVLFTWLNYAANAQSWLPYRSLVRSLAVSTHSTVTLLARLRGWSTSVPLSTAT